jgi:hypothetical protein
VLQVRSDRIAILGVGRIGHADGDCASVGKEQEMMDRPLLIETHNRLAALRQGCMMVLIGVRRR